MISNDMDKHELIDTANALVSNDEGLLAMDESNPTCNERFAKLGIAETEERRRAYREMIVTTSGLSDCISGAILFDETIRQNTLTGEPFIKVLGDQGIIPGIKVDAHAKALAGHPGEKITEGLDGLRERLSEYVEMGARFVYRSEQPVLTPELYEERHGMIANVVFPTGIDRRDDLGTPDRFDVYYGMADSRIGVARLDLPEHLSTSPLVLTPGQLAEC